MISYKEQEEEIKFGEDQIYGFRGQKTNFESLEDSQLQSFRMDNSLDLDRKSRLIVKVSPEASNNSLPTITNLIAKSLSLGKRVEIRIEGYGEEDAKENLDHFREGLDEDDEIEIYSEIDENEAKGIKIDDDTWSITDSLGSASKGDLITRAVNIAKTSELIALESVRILSDRIKKAAMSNNVLLSYAKQGYILKGENTEDLDRVEKIILNIYDEIQIVKLYKGANANQIEVIDMCSRKLLPAIAKKLNLKYIATLSSKWYYKTFERIARKVKELENDLTSQKKQKSSLRFILIQQNIRKNTQNQDQFIEEFRNSCKPRSVQLDICDSEALTQKEIQKITELAKKSHFHVSVNIMQTIKDERPQVDQKITLSTFARDENAKKILAEGEKLKKSIQKMLFPAFYYKFSNLIELHMYRNLLETEVQASAKLQNIELKVVQDTRNKGQERQKKDKTSELSLRISGKGDKAGRFYKTLCTVLRNINKRYVPVTLKGKHAMNILKILGKSQNNTFFTTYTAEAAKLFPGTFSSQDIREVVVKSEKNDHHSKKTELVMWVYSWDKQLLPKLEMYWKKFFETIESTQVPLPNKELPALFASFQTNLFSFKTFYKVAVDEYNAPDGKKKLTIVGEAKNVADAAEFLRSMTETMNPKTEMVDAGSYVILNAIKPELRKIIEKDIKITTEKTVFQLYGQGDKVQKAKDNLEALISQKKSQLKKDIQTGLASSHLKNLLLKRRNIIEQLQNEKEVNLQIIRGRNVEIIDGIEHSDTGRSVLLCRGKITKCQCDAITNCTDLDFSEGNIYQGASKHILDKAGNAYMNECGNRRLSAGQVLTTGAGNLLNCKAIINYCPPSCVNDKDLPRAIEDIKIGIRNIIVEASKNGYTSVAIPFFSALNYKVGAKETVVAILDELKDYLLAKYHTRLTVKNVYLCEIEQSKIEIAQNQLKTYLENKKTEKQSHLEEQIAQWQWAEDGNIWTDYDDDANRQIENAYQQGVITAKVIPSASRPVGSHVFDLTRQTMTRKSTKTLSTLQRKTDGWYESNSKQSAKVGGGYFGSNSSKKLPDRISTLIDAKQQQGIYVFELFMNEYQIDFKNMIQTNLATSYQRKIQRQVKVKIIPKAQGYSNEGLKGKNFSENPSASYSGKIIYEGFSSENIAVVKKKINEELEKQKQKKEVIIPNQIGSENISYLAKEIQKHEIVSQGELAPGKTVTLMGLPYQLSKIDSYLKVIQSVQSEDIKLPPHWSPMTDKQFLMVELQPNGTEWKDVSTRFSATMGSVRIRSIKRIQNLKFWRDYIREKKDLSDKHKKAGLKTDIQEALLWHGTRTTDPKIIYQDEEESFNLNYSNDGMWGRGLYFAVNASYSNGYAHSTPQGTKVFMLARVMIGDAAVLQPNGSLRKPPLRQGTLHPITYDSVKGNTGGSDVYILYIMRRAYPEYLVEYS